MKSDTETRIEVIEEIIRINRRKHVFAQMMIMFGMFFPVGIGGYFFLVHHGWFYGRPEFLIPLLAGVLVYIAIIRKVSRFATWVCFNEIEK